MILAYTLVAASGSAFGMVTVVSQVTNSRVEFDVAGATDSESDADSESEADVAAVPLHRLSPVDAQPTVAWDVVNDVILDWYAAAGDLGDHSHHPECRSRCSDERVREDHGNDGGELVGQYVGVDACGCSRELYGVLSSVHIGANG